MCYLTDMMYKRVCPINDWGKSLLFLRFFIQINTTIYKEILKKKEELIFF